MKLGDAEGPGISLGELETFLTKDVRQIRVLKKVRLVEFGFFLNHVCTCVRVKIPWPGSSVSVLVKRINFCTIDQLKFELCEGKKAASTSDNKTSFFSSPS